MRWFKHLSASHDDEKLASILFRENGLELYGFYWLITEIIARQMDTSNQTYLEYSNRKWASFAGVSPKKFQKFAETLSKVRLFSVKFSGKNIKIDCPTLLKIRDEYSRKKYNSDNQLQSNNVRTNSGQTPDNVAPDTDTDTEGESKEDVNNKPTKNNTTHPISKNPFSNSDLKTLCEKFPTVDVNMSLTRFIDHRTSKGFRIDLESFELWLEKDKEKGWNKKPPSDDIKLFCPTGHDHIEVNRQKAYQGFFCEKCHEQMVEKFELDISSNGKAPESLLNVFSSEFEKHFRAEYHASFGKDKKLLNSLETHYGRDQVISGIVYFFQKFIKDEKFAGKNPNVGMMYNQWNGMIAKSKKENQSNDVLIKWANE